jgi:outer membrane protein OmpA-like peptidoglycan-associated protein
LKLSTPLLPLVLLLTVSGCVGQGVYQKKVAEAERLNRVLHEVRGKQADVELANESLRTEVAGLRQQVVELQAAGKEFQRLLVARDDGSWQRLAQVEREKSRVTEELAGVLRDREGKVRSVSSIYERVLGLLAEEIAAGVVAVTELHGTVRIVVVDSALFVGDSGELAAQGSTVLRKVGDLLGGNAELRVTVEAYAPLPGVLVEQGKSTGSVWVVPLARAGNVAENFLRQGIKPPQLTTLVRGQFHGADGTGLPDTVHRINLLLEFKE